MRTDDREQSCRMARTSDERMRAGANDGKRQKDVQTLGLNPRSFSATEGREPAHARLRHRLRTCAPHAGGEASRTAPAIYVRALRFGPTFSRGKNIRLLFPQGPPCSAPHRAHPRHFFLSVIRLRPLDLQQRPSDLRRRPLDLQQRPIAFTFNQFPRAVRKCLLDLPKRPPSMMTQRGDHRPPGHSHSQKPRNRPRNRCEHHQGGQGYQRPPKVQGQPPPPRGQGQPPPPPPPLFHGAKDNHHHQWSKDARWIHARASAHGALG